MKTKKIKIKTSNQFWSDASSFAKAFDQGKKITLQIGEYFESLEAVRNILTEKRLELWRIIRDQKPASIRALAKLAKRDFKSTHRDVSLLIAVGLVELKKGNKGPAQKPISLADTLQVEVA